LNFFLIKILVSVPASAAGAFFSSEKQLFRVFDDLNYFLLNKPCVSPCPCRRRFFSSEKQLPIRFDDV